MDFSADVHNCTICFCPVVENNGQSTARLQCGHVFHLACIGTAFNARGIMQCPNCRHMEDSEWLLPGRDFAETIIVSSDDEEELQSEPEVPGILEMQPSELQWGMFNSFDEVLSHYEVIHNTYGLHYQNNGGPIVSNIQLSRPQTQYLSRPPTHLPVYGSMGTSISTHGVMTTAMVSTPTQSPYICTYHSDPLSSHIGATGLAELQLPPLAVRGRSNGSLPPVFLEDESSQSYGYSMYQFL